MDQLNNKNFNILKWIFIIVSIVFVIYATITMRGMYEDGGFYAISVLNNLANNNYSIATDWAHTRFFIMFLQQFPMLLSHWFLLIEDKTQLMMIFSFAQFAFPLLGLLWCYKLSKRTNRQDVFLWCLFTYAAINLVYSIFSVVEILIGSMFHFILWLYLTTKMEYTKKDIIGIIFLLTMMFATYEYTVVLGFLFFTASFFYVIKESELKNVLIKSIIGIVSLGASIFNIIYMCRVEGEGNEIIRFLYEGRDILQHSLSSNVLFTIIAIICMLVFAFRKNQLTNGILWSLFTIQAIAFIRLLNSLQYSLIPMVEQHFRIIPCFFIPLLFLVFFIYDIFKKENNNNDNKTKINNLICIVLICGIAQTAWQIVETYYWDKNIQYMKKELANEESLLYLPKEHNEQIADFFEENLRRYIWHGAYAFTSILFSDTYEVKTLLVNPDKNVNDGNLAYRERLYLPKYEKDVMHIPYGTRINLKNRYWDITNVAYALDEYNKKNNIQTEE